MNEYIEESSPQQENFRQQNTIAAPCTYTHTVEALAVSQLVHVLLETFGEAEFAGDERVDGQFDRVLTSRVHRHAGHASAIKTESFK